MTVHGAGDLGPGADAHAVGLRDPAVHRQRARRRLAVGPDALLERAAQLGLVRLAHEVVALVVERRVQEEAVVLEREVLVRLADAALAEGEQLLALGECAHGDGPFLESDRHKGGWKRELRGPAESRTADLRHDPARDCDRETSGRGVTYYAQSSRNHKISLQIDMFFDDAPFSMHERERVRSLQTRAGEALDDLEHRREVLLAEAAPDAGAVELARRGRRTGTRRRPSRASAEAQLRRP